VTESAAGPQGLNAPASYVLAAACLLVFLIVLWAVCGLKIYGPAQGQLAGPADRTRRRFWYIFLGTDDRVSTSKVQFALWTLALAYALLVIIFHDAVYPAGTLDPRYLLLLGFPAGAAVSAKAITMGQLSNGTVSKDPSNFEKKTPATAVKDIVSNDQGDLDLGDTQYFIFTLVTLTAFFIAFFHDPAKLPVLPDTLVGLTSASAAAYVAKKAASPATPVKIAAVSPQKGPVTTTVKIFGSGFGNATAGNGEPPDVTFGGLAAVVLGGWTDTMVRATPPQALPHGTADVQVIAAGGRTATLPGAFEVTPAPQGRRLMLDDLAYDHSELPRIGLMPAGVRWEEVKDHIRVAHGPLLVGPDASGQYTGAFWAGTELVIAEGLGPGQQQALREFRAFLRERGET
jgi:IPT/TIG domain